MTPTHSPVTPTITSVPEAISRNNAIPVANELTTQNATGMRDRWGVKLTSGEPDWCGLWTQQSRRSPLDRMTDLFFKVVQAAFRLPLPLAEQSPLSYCLQQRWDAKKKTLRVRFFPTPSDWTNLSAFQTKLWPSPSPMVKHSGLSGCSKRPRH